MFKVTEQPLEMITVEGVPFPTHFVTMETINAMKTWEARSEDAFVVSYPKAGMSTDIVGNLL